MRMLSKVKLNELSAGWFWFWAVALLVLPNCTFDRSGSATPSNVNKGTGDRTSAIFCDIEKPLPMTMPPTARRCATDADVAAGIRLADAAVALVSGQSSMMGLGIDDSPAALLRCGGQPEVIEFQGPFPGGSHVCLDCGTAIGSGPTQHATTAAVCTALCLDLFSAEDQNVPPTAEAEAFCASAARLATNFPTSGCFDGVCSTTGGLITPFADPRRIPEPVDWINEVGVMAVGGSLTRTAPFTGNFDAGASSMQLINQVITGGDAYVEFTATETNRTRIAGLSSGPPPPGGIQFADINFGIEFFNTGEMFVVENGSAVSSFGAYNPGEKFRVKLRDNFDGTAAVSYARIIGPCVDGSMCNENVFHPSTNTATYPVRVDAMFQDVGATLTEARIVRIR